VEIMQTAKSSKLSEDVRFGRVDMGVLALLFAYDRRMQEGSFARAISGKTNGRPLSCCSICISSGILARDGSTKYW